MACSAPRTCWTIWSSPSPVNTGWVIEWLATRCPGGRDLRHGLRVVRRPVPGQEEGPGHAAGGKGGQDFCQPCRVGSRVEGEGHYAAGAGDYRQVLAPEGLRKRHRPGRFRRLVRSFGWPWFGNRRRWNRRLGHGWLDRSLACL